VDVLHVILQILLGITSLLLTLLILLHKGRGGGLSDMFGGGMSSGLSSSGVAERNLNRFTIILGRHLGHRDHRPGTDYALHRQRRLLIPG
jgi:preprotein translocase subunit SecG